MERTKIKIVMIIIIFLLLISTSGCIHIDFGNPFIEEEPKPTTYNINTKMGFPMSHSFDVTDIRNPDIKYSDTQPFIIKKHTQWVNITIKVEIYQYSFFDISPFENYTYFEQYVEVRIEKPNDEIYFEQKFIDTDEENRGLDSPEKGVWKVFVEAAGLGYEDVHDKYYINVIVNEPS